MTRAEHLQWAKDRALAYLELPKPAFIESGGCSGERHRYLDSHRNELPREVSEANLRDAVASFISDLGKHPELASHPVLLFVGFEMMRTSFWQVDEIRRFINGTN